MTDQRVIPKERGEAISREHSITFMETSAKANINIEAAFMHLTEVILNKVGLSKIILIIPNATHPTCLSKNQKLREQPEEIPQNVNVTQRDFTSRINKCC